MGGVPSSVAMASCTKVSPGSLGRMSLSDYADVVGCVEWVDELYFLESVVAGSRWRMDVVWLGSGFELLKWWWVFGFVLLC